MTLVLGRPVASLGQVGAGTGSPPTAPGPRATGAYPEFRRAQEVTLFGVGAALFVAGHLVRGDVPVVPPQGLDPGRIGWSVDRRVVGNRSLDAHVASNRTRNAAVLFPFVVALATGPGGERWEAFRRQSLVFTQAYMVSQGLTFLGKSAFGRARPYTYLAGDVRVDDPAYDVTTSAAFSSMPSGHSSSAWTGAALAMTEYLLGHPETGWMSRGGVGLAGGALAGSTAALRVRAGQHFPSDVLVGAGIGIATGVAVPLLHRGGRRAPSTAAWFEMTGGAVAGTLVGILFARRY